MLTKKEKLLIRPWIVQRYRNHRNKVKSAGPAIDFYCPSAHPHVTTKWKKMQKEEERRKEIERENVRLLQKLGTIMNTLPRLDNFWKKARPNFLNRELIYKPHPKKIEKEEDSEFKFELPDEISFFKNSNRRCTACYKTLNQWRPKSNQVEPDVRVPWAPPKKSFRNVSIEENIHICCRYCC